MYTWQRYRGYEVSSKGDKRFSAFNAILSDGRSIEQHYQCDVKGYNIGGTNMGDDHFKLGNIHTNTHSEIFGGQKLRDLISKSCVETIPGCASCAYQAYCGADPIRNYLESGHEIRNMLNTPFCIKHKAIFDFLFEILSGSSEEEENIIWSWVRNTNLVEVNA